MAFQCTLAALYFLMDLIAFDIADDGAIQIDLVDMAAAVSQLAAIGWLASVAVRLNLVRATIFEMDMLLSSRRKLLNKNR